MIRLLLVDDHELIREGVKALLERTKDIEVIAEAANTDAALQLVQQYQPDIVLLDIQLPGTSNIDEMLSQLTAYPQTRCIILSSYDEEPYPSRMLSLGAYGYLSKNCQAHELITAIEKVASGEKYLSARIAKQLEFKLLRKQPTEQESPFESLSPQELICAKEIASGKSVAEIAKMLAVGERTINTYRYRIFNKLQINSDVALVKLALRYQLIEGQKDNV